MPAGEDHTDERQDFERLWDAHHPRVLAYARRRLPDHDAQDVAADTFLVAWRRRDQMPAGPATLPWLYGVARKVVSDARRSEARRRRLSDRMAAEAAVSISAGDSAIEERGLVRALAQLSETDREALLLVAWEGLGNAEAAAAMSVSPVAFRVRLHRARRRLAHLLEAEQETVPEGRSRQEPSR